MGYIPAQVAQGTSTTVAALCGNDDSFKPISINLDHLANLLGIVARAIAIPLEVSLVADPEVAATITFSGS
jgi:hypothetical protein